MSELLQYDEALFFLINREGQAAWLDFLAPIWRNKYTWLPLYAVLLAFSVYKFRWKGIGWVILLIATVGASDLISHRVVKQQVQRPRPCQSEMIKEDVRLLVPCGSGYSFTSNHAANHFALAVFFAGSLGIFFRRWAGLFYAWAFGVAYAQIYVGVHYPLDALGGAALGLLIGGLTTLIWKRIS